MGSKSYSKGISWFSDCRIPFVDEDKPTGGFGGARIGYGNEYEYDGVCGKANSQGRFPANILVSDDMLNDGVIYQSGKVQTHHKRKKTLGQYQGNAYGKYNNESPELNYDNYYGDKGTNSRYYNIDKWFDKILE